MAPTRAYAAAAIVLLCSACAHRAPQAHAIAARVTDPATPALESAIPAPWPTAPAPEPSRSANVPAPSSSATALPSSSPVPAPIPAHTSAQALLPAFPALRLWLVPTPRPRERRPAFSAVPFAVRLPAFEPPEQPIARIPYLPSDAMPRIVGISLPSDNVRGGQTIVGEVRASSNVASVEVRVANYGASMEKIAPGEFTLAVTVPHLPFFLRNRTYTIRVIARNTRGDSVTQAVPVVVR
ncbi:MAG: hypothetical protein ACREMP_06180 [Candidatus Tyrphobacter sp.]